MENLGDKEIQELILELEEDEISDSDEELIGNEAEENYSEDDLVSDADTEEDSNETVQCTG